MFQKPDPPEPTFLKPDAARTAAEEASMTGGGSAQPGVPK